jgi:2-dehydro-3-deoxyphosphogluconate aldolase/(4S)-4-hydroxy-2-oxoglutarate aldolase
MSSEIEKRLRAVPVVPLVEANDPRVAVRTAQALVDGGLTIVEVVLRTEEAFQCLSAIIDSVPDAVSGAGTVLNAEQAQAAVQAGARFIVSPGLDDGVVEIARKNKLPVYPGVATATELQRARNMGLRTVKFFPAGLAGGPAMLKALGSVFRDMSFMPTGGVSAANLADYLAVPSVIACGGSWLTPKTEIDKSNFDAVTELAREAASIASTARA